MADENPFAGISGIETTKSSDFRLKIALVGVPKTGKSWLTSTARPPIFSLDFDDRAESIKGKPGVGVKTYVDKDYLNPTAMKDVEKDLAMYKYNKSKGLSIPATYCLDSMTYLKKAIENELMSQQSSLCRVIKAGGRQMRIPQGWDIVNGVRSYMEYLIGEFSALGDLICVFHRADEKDNVKSTKEEKKYTGKFTVQPQYLSSLLSVFNEVWMIDYDAYTKKFQVIVKPNDDFQASSSMEIALGDIEEPNIMKMVDKYKKLRGL